MKTHTYVGLAAATLAVALLSGCVSTSFQPDPSRSPGRFPVVSPSDVHVFRSFPAQPYQKLGVIEANLSGHHTSEAVLREVRQAAGAIGANAIVCEPGSTLFAEPSSHLMDVVSPEAVSFTFSALRLIDQ